MSRDRIYQYQVIFYSNRGVDLERMVKIPPPVLKENEAEYLEELSKIKKAEDWVEKYSGESISYQTGDDTEQNHVVISTQIIDKFFNLGYFTDAVYNFLHFSPCTTIRITIIAWTVFRVIV